VERIREVRHSFDLHDFGYRGHIFFHPEMELFGNVPRNLAKKKLAWLFHLVHQKPGELASLLQEATMLCSYTSYSFQETLAITQNGWVYQIRPPRPSHVAYVDAYMLEATHGWTIAK